MGVTRPAAATGMTGAARNRMKFGLGRVVSDYDRAALRWLGRYVTEGRGVSLLKAQLAPRAGISPKG